MLGVLLNTGELFAENQRFPLESGHEISIVTIAPYPAELTREPPPRGSP
jgi:hypothetical protein